MLRAGAHCVPLMLSSVRSLGTTTPCEGGAPVPGRGRGRACAPSCRRRTRRARRAPRRHSRRSSRHPCSRRAPPVARGRVVAALLLELEHPVGPARRPPDEEERVGGVLVRRVGQRPRLGRDAGGRAESEGPSARRVLRAPVGDGRVVDGAEAVRAHHVVLEPAAVGAIVRRG
eukprot:scaffold92682_cov65-Phaeocystis_antarctica.AAC.5